MGLGGGLIWTGLARNLKQRFPSRKIILIYKKSILNRSFEEHSVFNNNDDIHLVVDKLKWFFIRRRFNKNEIIIVNMNDPQYIYCEKDTKEKMTYKTGRHAIQIACDVHGITNAVLRPKIILSKEERNNVNALLGSFSLNKLEYICIEPNFKTSFSPNKGWFQDRWQSLVSRLNEYFTGNNSNIKIVQVGPSTDNILSGVINLTDRTSFREAAGILENALTFISYEGGLTHLSQAAGKKGVVLISAMLPRELMAYPANINLYSDLDCKNCGLKVPCPKERECMKMITVDEVFEASKKIMAELRNETAFSF